MFGLNIALTIYRHMVHRTNQPWIDKLAAGAIMSKIILCFIFVKTMIYIFINNSHKIQLRVVFCCYMPDQAYFRRIGLTMPEQPTDFLANIEM